MANTIARAREPATIGPSSCSAEVDKALEAEQARQAEQQARDEVQKRYRRFLDHRKEALFRDTQFTGAHCCRPTSNSPARRPRRRSASSQRTAGGDDWTTRRLSRGPVEANSRPRFEEGCYELLLVLAEAVAAQGPAQVDRALRDPRQRRPVEARAFPGVPPEESVLPGARRTIRPERLANSPRPSSSVPETAFDYFLSGQQEYKLKRLADAIQDFEIALRKKPDHFWAKCLLAICYIQTSRFEAAKSCLNGCLQTDRDFAWLYLLRGFASGQLGRQVSRTWSKDSPGREAGPENSRPSSSSTRPRRIFATPSSGSRARPTTISSYVLLVNRGLIRFQRGRLDAGRRRLPGGHPAEEGPVPGPCRARPRLREARQDRPRRSSSSRGPSP